MRNEEIEKITHRKNCPHRQGQQAAPSPVTHGHPPSPTLVPSSHTPSLLPIACPGSSCPYVPVSLVRHRSAPGVCRELPVGWFVPSASCPGTAHAGLTLPRCPPLAGKAQHAGSARRFYPECESCSHSHLSGVRLFPFSFTSRSSSEESTGEVVLASRSSCSCWARYWAGFCLASLAQCSSSRCSRGRLACKSVAHIYRGGRVAHMQFQQG